MSETKQQLDPKVKTVYEASLQNLPKNILRRVTKEKHQQELMQWFFSSLMYLHNLYLQEQEVEQEMNKKEVVENE